MIYFFKWKFTAHERHRINSYSGQSLPLTHKYIVFLSSVGIPSNLHVLFSSQYALAFFSIEDMTLHKSFSYLVISLSHY